MSHSGPAISLVLFFASVGMAQQTEVSVQNGTFVPAGTLLHCTLDEPNFSSATAQVGDPVLCRTTSIEMFGRPLIPRGAYLSARLEEFKDPGHFFGKGWLQLEFTSLTLPAGNFPISAKVISAARYRVDGEGKIRGHGHPTRDVVEWMIPILWPEKVLTLPARGPRPTLKGETRVELRLMEDVLLPESERPSSGGLPSRSSLSRPHMESSSLRQLPNPVPRYRTTPVQTLTSGLTLLVLRGGRVYLVADYWVDRANLDFTTGTGNVQSLPMDELDMPITTQLNAERGVPFVLKSTHY
jgi:hypothetical protein